jgi:hypothetical protein
MRIYEAGLKRKSDRKTNAEVMSLLPDKHVKELVGSIGDRLKLVQGGVG